MLLVGRSGLSLPRESKTIHTYKVHLYWLSWVAIFESLLDVMTSFLGTIPIKWRQRLGMTIYADRDVKHQFKHTNKNSLDMYSLCFMLHVTFNVIICF